MTLLCPYDDVVGQRDTQICARLPLFYITSMDGKRAQIYPLKEWEEIEESLKKMSPMDPVRRKFQDVTNFYGQMAEMDAQGRLLIPQKLREMAKVTGDVEVLGSQTLLEVVNSEVFTSMAG